MWTLSISILIIFIIFQSQSTKAIDEDDDNDHQQESSQSKQIECFEHFNCLSLQRNNDHLQTLKLNSTLPNWYELCNCDPYCYIFGDCCSDAPAVDKINLDHWTFVRVRFSSRINFLTLMKNHCPNDYEQNEYIRIQCEHSSYDQIYDYLLPDMEQYLLFDQRQEFNNWHLTSRKSLITYRNLYCSICNNDTETDAWNQRLMCQNDNDNDNHHCSTIHHQMAPEILGKEKLKRTPLLNKVYSSCNLGWYKMNYPKNPKLILETMKKCIIFYAPVAVKDSKSKKYILFKNKYCAHCNGYRSSMIECARMSVDQPTQVPPTFNSIATLDTNQLFVDNKDQQQQQQQQCPTIMSIWNPLIQQCQEIDNGDKTPIGYHNLALRNYDQCSIFEMIILLIFIILIINY
ncbi:hypothetical protein BLA29_002776 [Euroglyphus maynei]|uniref:SMB domain-containing protein n=1 Tax=Euroglyphus maynei TaxID=6958 RepID=A0A1Y3AX33_EURMA|nr:hypothetical protein BLA29_002776 [Euroglyphus maynei]